MKKIVSILLTVTLVFSTSIFAVAETQDIGKTNIGGLEVTPNFDDDGPQNFTIKTKSESENLEKDGILLFINGSIILNSHAVIENDRVLVPIRVVSETLNANVDWDETTKEVTISDSENVVTLFVGSTEAKINSENITLDVAPKIINDFTYVPLRFISEGLGASVEYSQGIGDNRTKDRTKYMIYGIKQVMIGKYEAEAKQISKEEAVALVYEDLKYAYEKRFEKEFVPLDGKPVVEDGNYPGDEENFRYTFSHLEVIGETDRYYVIPVVFDFWVDKYTGDIYVYYNGLGKTVNEFDKEAAVALAFAG